MLLHLYTGARARKICSKWIVTNFRSFFFVCCFFSFTITVRSGRDRHQHCADDGAAARGEPVVDDDGCDARACVQCDTVCTCARRLQRRSARDKLIFVIFFFHTTQPLIRSRAALASRKGLLRRLSACSCDLRSRVLQRRVELRVCCKRN